MRTKILRVAPNYSVKNRALMRGVHLRARAGPASTLEVPVILLPLVDCVRLHDPDFHHPEMISAKTETSF